MILENMNTDIREYFNKMPTSLQELIMQGGVKIESVEQLKEIERNFTKSKD